ncbi:MAG: arginine--tRNA ligase [Candidatus Thermoplasmatota archaeon]|nr:arginine--tRNA ligase [Candidatus Thermoplasmatota archaeon]
MLVFRDFRDDVARASNGSRLVIKPSDVEIDSKGFADYVIRVFRYRHEDWFGSWFSAFSEAVRSLDFIERCELSGDYINISISGKSLFSTIKQSMDTVGVFPETFQDPDRVVVEHTSANPTGPIHVGRIRNSIIGDSMARIMSRYGYRVSTQYFVNDSGKQVMALYEGHKRFFPDSEMTVDNLMKGYQKIYSEMESLGGEDAVLGPLLKRYEIPDTALIEEIRGVCTIVLNSIRNTLLKLNIKIDDFVFESGFLQGEEIARAFEMLEGSLRAEGAARYVDTPWGKKEFLVRSDGTKLYLARDLAYHLFKADHFDVIVDVLGEDHKDYAKSLKYILSDLIGVDKKIEFLIYSFISLEGSKLSTRQGNIITVEDLITRADQEARKIIAGKQGEYSVEAMENIAKVVATNSVRFNIVRVNPQKPMVFRWEDAMNTDGDSAPFIMYSYSRAFSIMEKTRPSQKLSLEFDSTEKGLLWNMYLYADFIKRSVDSKRPDLIAFYLLNLTKAFNDFYSRCQVNVDDDGVRGRRLEITSMYSRIVRDAAGLLGMNVLDRM